MSSNNNNNKRSWGSDFKFGDGFGGGGDDDHHHQGVAGDGRSLFGPPPENGFAFGGGGGGGGVAPERRTYHPVLDQAPQSLFGNTGLFGSPAPAPPASLFGAGATKGRTVGRKGRTFFSEEGVTAKALSFYPKPLDTSQKMKNLYEIHRQAFDTSFSFPIDEAETGMNDMNPPTNMLFAHKSILEKSSPQLYDMIRDAHEGETIEIAGTSQSVFHHLLINSYFGDIPKPTSNGQLDLGFAKDLLLASDKYGNVGLKLSMQSLIIDHGLDTGNAAGLLVISHSHSCALLKEACLEMTTKFYDEVTATPGWSEVSQCNNPLGFELSKHMNDQKKRNEWGNKLYELHTDGLFGSPVFPAPFELLSVVELLKELELRGLSLDGTKEMLVERLKTHFQQERAQQAAQAPAAPTGGDFVFGGPNNSN